MNKFLSISLLAALAFILPTALRAGDQNSLFSKAMNDATVKACVQDAREPGYTIEFQAETTGICFVSGETSRVSIYKVGRCPANSAETCRPIAILVATADIGCEGEVMTSTCF